MSVYGNQYEITIDKLLNFSNDSFAIEKLISAKDPYYKEMKAK